jgi:hypothetical protein
MSNLPTLQTLVDWSNIGVVISLALSFVFGGASIFLGSRLGKIKDAEAATARQNLELAVAAQQERAANAEKALAEVQKRTKFRTLSPEQKTRLIEILKAYPGKTRFDPTVTVQYVLRNEESHQFALQFVAIFTEARWFVLGKEGTPSLRGGPTFSGLDVVINKNPDAAAFLGQALMEVGLEGSTNVARAAVVSPADVILVVGLRP